MINTNYPAQGDSLTVYQAYRCWERTELVKVAPEARRRMIDGACVLVAAGLGVVTVDKISATGIAAFQLNAASAYSPDRIAAALEVLDVVRRVTPQPERTAAADPRG